MNKDHGWIVAAANHKIDMVLLIRHVTAPRADLGFLCAAYATALAAPNMCIAIRCQVARSRNLASVSLEKSDRILDPRRGSGVVHKGQRAVRSNAWRITSRKRAILT